MFGNFPLQSSSANAAVLKQKKQRNAIHLIFSPLFRNRRLIFERYLPCTVLWLGTPEALGGPSGRLSVRIEKANLTH